MAAQAGLSLVGNSEDRFSRDMALIRVGAFTRINTAETFVTNSIAKITKTMDFSNRALKTCFSSGNNPVDNSNGIVIL